jgi:hypothetical protein
MVEEFAASAISSLPASLVRCRRLGFAVIALL